ncbi:hypothetical protein [Hyphococcus sp. DH-69]|uniref:hypothetical protein n=1 Tax=Hyphococcus formosus TaxID=3143534 RepID=UPI00398B740B
MRRILNFTAISVASLLINQATAAPKESVKKPSTQSTTIKTKELDHTIIMIDRIQGAREKAFSEADKMGLTINGYGDVKGLNNVLKDHFNQTSLGRTALDEQAKKIEEAGLDFAALRELDSLLRSGPIAIERIEYVPGWDAGGHSNGIIMRPDQLGDYEGNEFTPGLPSKGSLAGYSYHIRRNPDGGYTETIVFDDGSHIIQGSSDNDAGGKTHFVVVFADGQVRYTERVDTDKRGNVTEERVYINPEPHETSEAEEEHAARQRETSGASVTVGEPTEEESGDTEDADIEGYQPADGTAGVFCPMTVEICRREYNRAISSREKVFAGMIFVNPGDPDDQPKGPRLVYDPEDLAINPYFSSGAGSKKLNPGQFRMVLPVLVNPPGPDEE